MLVRKSAILQRERQKSELLNTFRNSRTCWTIYIQTQWHRLGVSPVGLNSLWASHIRKTFFISIYRGRRRCRDKHSWGNADRSHSFNGASLELRESPPPTRLQWSDLRQEEIRISIKGLWDTNSPSEHPCLVRQLPFSLGRAWQGGPPWGPAQHGPSCAHALIR